MKIRLLGVLLITAFLMGCSTSKYATAERHFKKKEYQQAIREYVNLMEPHSRGGKRLVNYDSETFTRIGIVYWHMRRFDTAIQVLRQVIEKDPTFGKALFYMGLSLEGLGKEDEAIASYRKYPSVLSYDHYRKALVGRLDWVVRNKIAREIQVALNNEAQLQISDYPEKSVAVFYFLSLSEDPQWRPLQKGIAEMIITDLSQVEELKVIERLRLNRLIEEMNLSMTGLMDESTGPRLGKLLGARSIVKGSYLITSTMQTTLDAGIYPFDGIVPPEPKHIEGNLTQLFQMEKQIVLQILAHFGIEMTQPQRERFYRIPTKNMNAFMYYCKGLDALDHNDFASAQDMFREAVFMDNDFIEARDQLMSLQMWEATHNRNAIRVDYDLTALIKTLPKGRPEEIYRPPALLSTRDRLQRMAAYQNAGFLPGTDSRKSIEEAGSKGAPVIPVLLGEPPKPPTNK